MFVGLTGFFTGGQADKIPGNSAGLAWFVQEENHNCAGSRTVAASAGKATAMQNKKHFFTLLLLALSWSTTASCHAASDSFRGGEYLKSVSMIELIANPEKFDGKRVIVSGFVHFEFEGNALYFHEEDYRAGLRQNGIALYVTPEQQKQYAVCELKSCFVVGTFHATLPQHFSLWSGHLTDITAIHTLILPTNKPTSSRLHKKIKAARNVKSEQTASKLSAVGSLP